jgi:hypothetical protein
VADGTAPKLACPEPEFSFGALTNTREVIHEFVIRNEGDAPLEIYRVKLPCGCMLLRLLDNKLEPGEQTILRARFPLKDLSGSLRKRIILFTNDPFRPQFTLWLTGEAIAEIELRPRELFWGNLLADAKDGKTVEIRFQAGEKYRVTGVRSSTPLFAAEVEPAPPPLSRIKVSPIPPLARGSFQGSLTIQTDHPRFATLTVPLSGRVVDEIYAIPEELVLAPTNQPVARAIMVYAGQKQKFSVLKVAVPATNIEVKIRTSLFSGCRVELKNILIDPALDGQAVVITTDYAPLKEIRVPLRIRAPEEVPE